MNRDSIKQQLSFENSGFYSFNKAKIILKLFSSVEQKNEHTVRYNGTYYNLQDYINDEVKINQAANEITCCAEDSNQQAVAYVS